MMHSCTKYLPYCNSVNLETVYIDGDPSNLLEAVVRATEEIEYQKMIIASCALVVWDVSVSVVFHVIVSNKPALFDNCDRIVELQLDHMTIL